MGWCHEFGVTVRESCGHPMTAGESACHCTVCDVVCEGQFSGCSTVWAQGPREVGFVRPQSDDAPLVAAAPSSPAAEASAPSEPPSEPALPVVWTEERGQVFEWLQDSFDGLQSQLRVLSDTLDRQQGALATISAAGDAAGRLSEVADALPKRVGEAVRAALLSTGMGAARPPGNGDAARTPGAALNRAGWQDKLRALGSARSQFADWH